MSALGVVSVFWRLYLKTQMSQKGLSDAEGEWWETEKKSPILLYEVGCYNVSLILWAEGWCSKPIEM